LETCRLRGRRIDGSRTGEVTTGATISLDGFIADASHGSFDYLFKWYRGR
jgi:hypothetical protein